MPTTIAPTLPLFPTAVHTVTLERNGWTYLTIQSGDGPDLSRLEPHESDAYHRGRLIPSRRPVRPVRCYEGARS